MATIRIETIQGRKLEHSEHRLNKIQVHIGPETIDVEPTTLKDIGVFFAKINLRLKSKNPMKTLNVRIMHIHRENSERQLSTQDINKIKNDALLTLNLPSKYTSTPDELQKLKEVTEQAFDILEQNIALLEEDNFLAQNLVVNSNKSKLSSIVEENLEMESDSDEETYQRRRLDASDDPLGKPRFPSFDRSADVEASRLEEDKKLLRPLLNADFKPAPRISLLELVITNPLRTQYNALLEAITRQNTVTYLQYIVAEFMQLRFMLDNEKTEWMPIKQHIDTIYEKIANNVSTMNVSTMEDSSRDYITKNFTLEARVSHVVPPSEFDEIGNQEIDNEEPPQSLSSNELEFLSLTLPNNAGPHLKQLFTETKNAAMDWFKERSSVEKKSYLQARLNALYIGVSWIGNSADKNNINVEKGIIGAFIQEIDSHITLNDFLSGPGTIIDIFAKVEKPTYSLFKDTGYDEFNNNVYTAIQKYQEIPTEENYKHAIIQIKIFQATYPESTRIEKNILTSIETELDILITSDHQSERDVAFFSILKNVLLHTQPSVKNTNLAEAEAEDADTNSDDTENLTKEIAKQIKDREEPPMFSTQYIENFLAGKDDSSNDTNISMSLTNTRSAFKDADFIKAQFADLSEQQQNMLLTAQKNLQTAASANESLFYTTENDLSVIIKNKLSTNEPEPVVMFQIDQAINLLTPQQQKKYIDAIKIYTADKGMIALSGRINALHEDSTMFTRPLQTLTIGNPKAHLKAITDILDSGGIDMDIQRARTEEQAAKLIALKKDLRDTQYALENILPTKDRDASRKNRRDNLERESDLNYEDKFNIRAQLWEIYRLSTALKHVQWSLPLFSDYSDPDIWFLIRKAFKPEIAREFLVKNDIKGAKEYITKITESLRRLSSSNKSLTTALANTEDTTFVNNALKRYYAINYNVLTKLHSAYTRERSRLLREAPSEDRAAVLKHFPMHPVDIVHAAEQIMHVNSSMLSEEFKTAYNAVASSVPERLPAWTQLKEYLDKVITLQKTLLENTEEYQTLTSFSKNLRKQLFLQNDLYQDPKALEDMILECDKLTSSVQAWVFDAKNDEENENDEESEKISAMDALINGSDFSALKPEKITPELSWIDQYKKINENAFDTLNREYSGYKQWITMNATTNERTRIERPIISRLNVINTSYPDLNENNYLQVYQKIEENLTDDANKPLDRNDHRLISKVVTAFKDYQNSHKNIEAFVMEPLLALKALERPTEYGISRTPEAIAFDELKTQLKKTYAPRDYTDILRKVDSFCALSSGKLAAFDKNFNNAITKVLNRIKKLNETSGLGEEKQLANELTSPLRETQDRITKKQKANPWSDILNTFKDSFFNSEEDFNTLSEEHQAMFVDALRNLQHAASKRERSVDKEERLSVRIRRNLTGEYPKVNVIRLDEQTKELSPELITAYGDAIKVYTADKRMIALSHRMKELCNRGGVTPPLQTLDIGNPSAHLKAIRDVLRSGAIEMHIQHATSEKNSEALQTLQRDLYETQDALLSTLSTKEQNAFTTEKQAYTQSTDYENETFTTRAKLWEIHRLSTALQRIEWKTSFFSNHNIKFLLNEALKPEIARKFLANSDLKDAEIYIQAVTNALQKVYTPEHTSLITTALANPADEKFVSAVLKEYHAIDYDKLTELKTAYESERKKLLARKPSVQRAIVLKHFPERPTDIVHAAEQIMAANAYCNILSSEFKNAYNAAAPNMVERLPAWSALREYTQDISTLETVFSKDKTKSALLASTREFLEEQLFYKNDLYRDPDGLEHMISKCEALTQNVRKWLLDDKLRGNTEAIEAMNRLAVSDFSQFMAGKLHDTYEIENLSDFHTEIEVNDFYTQCMDTLRQLQKDLFAFESAPTDGGTAPIDVLNKEEATFIRESTRTLNGMMETLNVYSQSPSETPLKDTSNQRADISNVVAKTKLMLSEFRANNAHNPAPRLRKILTIIAPLFTITSQTQQNERSSQLQKQIEDTENVELSQPGVLPTYQNATNDQKKGYDLIYNAYYAFKNATPDEKTTKLIELNNVIRNNPNIIIERKKLQKIALINARATDRLAAIAPFHFNSENAQKRVESNEQWTDIESLREGLINVLDDYLTRRTNDTYEKNTQEGVVKKTKSYSYSWLIPLTDFRFHPGGISYKEKADAVKALSQALRNELADPKDLRTHLEALNNGQLKKDLTAFLESDAGLTLLDAIGVTEKDFTLLKHKSVITVFITRLVEHLEKPGLTALRNNAPRP